jgi:hypothetical protein
MNTSTRGGKYYWSHREQCLRRSKELYYKKREARIAQQKVYNEAHKVSVAKARALLKVETFEHYDGVRCAKCSIIDIDVLDLDHIANDGYKNRKRKGWQLYLLLKKQGWPSGFQVLCRNCNWKKHLENKRKVLFS